MCFQETAEAEKAARLSGVRYGDSNKFPSGF